MGQLLSVSVARLSLRRLQRRRGQCIRLWSFCGRKHPCDNKRKRGVCVCVCERACVFVIATVGRLLRPATHWALPRHRCIYSCRRHHEAGCWSVIVQCSTRTWETWNRFAFCCTIHGMRVLIMIVVPHGMAMTAWPPVPLHQSTEESPSALHSAPAANTCAPACPVQGLTFETRRKEPREKSCTCAFIASGGGRTREGKRST